MDEIINIDTIHKSNAYMGIETLHPLVSVVDFSKTKESYEFGTKITTGFYAVIFKNYSTNRIMYGRKYYDFQEGSLFCISPRRVISLNEPVEISENPEGWGVFFHPDLIRRTSLEKRIKEYSFFSYDTEEALHLSDKEKQILYDCVQKIDSELSENIDNHSQTLIVSNIELLLNYCTRYYDRQFITRKNVNSDICVKVEEFLRQYFQSELAKTGLPTVKLLSDRFCLSPNYLSDLLKKETGMNAQELIHHYLLEEAKILLQNSGKSIGELAYSLGFEYPQYFSRLFKIKTGVTPSEYRNCN